jgi:hypothetical protein
MAKRQNRLAALAHESRQLENLKTLEPIATPDAARPLSDALFDLTLATLEELYALEEGQPIEARRLKKIHDLVEQLPSKITSE